MKINSVGAIRSQLTEKVGGSESPVAPSTLRNCLLLKFASRLRHCDRNLDDNRMAVQVVKHHPVRQTLLLIHKFRDPRTHSNP